MVKTGDNARVTKRRCMPRLTPEASQKMRVRGVPRTHHLDRDLSFEAHVHTPVHGRHATPGDQTVHTVSTVQNNA